MTDLHWAGGTGDWLDRNEWLDPSGRHHTPKPGDETAIDDGLAFFYGYQGPVYDRYDSTTATLGSNTKEAPATFALDDAVLGSRFSLHTLAGTFAAIEANGTSGLSGQLSVDGALTLDGGTGSLVLLDGSDIKIAAGAVLAFDGFVKIERHVFIGQGGAMVNDGTIVVTGIRGGLGSAATGHTTSVEPLKSGLILHSQATLSGTGTIGVGLGGSVDLNGTVSAGQTISFLDTGAQLIFGGQQSFAGRVTNFQAGDLMTLKGVTGDYAAYDAAASLLVVKAGGATGTTVASFAMQGATTAPLVTTVVGNDTTIAVRGAPTVLTEALAAGARAMRADVVHATMTTADGAAIDGSGVKIGIISNSFNTMNGMAADIANGYLPSIDKVHVLKDLTSSASDEGREMAQLVHQIAPGAEIYFYSGDTPGGIAAAVDALVQQGCTVIADDLSGAAESYFQVAGAGAAAVADAISKGVSYFTSAGNTGNAYYEADFRAASTTLDHVEGPVSAQMFSNGTDLQTIVVPGGTACSIALQWDQAWGSVDAAQPAGLEIVAYDATGKWMGSSTQTETSVDGQNKRVPSSILTLTNRAQENATYRIAIFQKAGAPTVTHLKYILDGSSATDGTEPGGTIEDPAAQNGSGAMKGHKLVPGVNVVAASTYANSPVFGTGSFVDDFSNAGPGQLYFDQDGNRLATPLADDKVTFTATDGVVTSVPSNPSTFFGTSAAAPSAAAVAALLLQAHPGLSPAAVTRIMQSSASDMGLPTALQGAGYVQADKAVALALETGGPRPYASTALVRDAADHVVGKTYFNADGSLYLGVGFGKTDAGTTRVYEGGSAFAAGTVSSVVKTYDATGSLVSRTAYDGDEVVEQGRFEALANGHTVYATTGGSMFAGKAYDGFTDDRAATGAVLSRTYRKTDGDTIVKALGKGLTLTATDSPETFVFGQDFRASTVAGFMAAGPDHDILALSKNSFADRTALLAAIHENGHGSAVILDQANKGSITLAGVSVDVLRSHIGDIHLYG